MGSLRRAALAACDAIIVVGFIVLMFVYLMRWPLVVIWAVLMIAKVLL